MAPDAATLAGFRLEGPASALAGGQGDSWRVGNAVLKPVYDVTEASWVADILDALRDDDGFRVAQPLRSVAGSWVVNGWTASTFLVGEHDVRARWREVLAAGAAFHAALCEVPRPTFLDARSHAWATGDRAAWGEAPAVPVLEEFASLAEQFGSLITPTAQPAQVVHGDLTANVLFADGMAPAVIDFSPYWRPVAFAAAVVAADAIAWHGAGVELARLLVDEPASMLARAALYRLITSDHILSAAAASESGDAAGDLAREVAAYERVLRVLQRL